jgi:hypothetical protein
MGLDNFKDDENDRTNSSSDNSNNNSDNSGDAVDNGENKSGLESFNTNTDRGGNTKETQSDNQNDKPHGIEPKKWNNMSVKERVAAVRKSNIPDYRPEVQLDERWSHSQVTLIECVCGNVFKFAKTGVCSVCDREYAERNRTVVKTHDPKGEIINNNASKH